MSSNPWSGATTSHFFIEELTPGETPATPAWESFRYTGGIPTITKDALEAEELDDSREITDIRTGNESVSGEMSVNLSPGSYSAILENAMKSTKVAGLNIAAVEITVDDVAKTFTRTAGDFFADGVEVGDLIYFPSLTGNNASPFTVTAVTTTVVTGAAITVELTAETVTTDYVTGDEISAGSECKSISILTDLKGRCGTIQKYMITRGVEITGFSFEVAVNALVSGSFPLIGRSQELLDAPPAGSTFNPEPTGRVFSGVDGKVLVDDTVQAFVTSASLTNDNSASPQFTLGSKSVDFVEIGRARNTISIAAFFADFSLHERFLNETETKFTVVLTGPSGAISFTYEKVFLTASTPEIGGETSITQTLEGTATGNTAQSSLVIREIVFP